MTRTALIIYFDNSNKEQRQSAGGGVPGGGRGAGMGRVRLCVGGWTLAERLGEAACRRMRGVQGNAVKRWRSGISKIQRQRLLVSENEKKLFLKTK
jgi:hypothetical protein